MTSISARGCGYCSGHARATRTVARGKEGHRTWRTGSLLGDGDELGGMRSSRVAARARTVAHEGEDDSGIRFCKKARTVGRIV